VIDVYLCLLYHPSAGARWQSGYAAVCKTVYIGSIPVRASIFSEFYQHSKGSVRLFCLAHGFVVRQFCLPDEVVNIHGALN
jgi:hypothetical protein